MAGPEITLNDDTGLYEDTSGNTYYDTEGRESADGND